MGIRLEPKVNEVPRQAHSFVFYFTDTGSKVAYRKLISAKDGLDGL